MAKKAGKKQTHFLKPGHLKNAGYAIF